MEFNTSVNSFYQPQTAVNYGSGSKNNETNQQQSSVSGQNTVNAKEGNQAVLDTLNFIANYSMAGVNMANHKIKLEDCKTNEDYIAFANQYLTPERQADITKSVSEYAAMNE